MHHPLISVVVPVYKAEPYFQKCIDSIRNQTYTNLEILLVDDGSPDRCGEMCDAFAKEDSRIRVFHKENGGQSSARNVALDAATGEYIGFVDSDDYIDPDMYALLYGMIVDSQAQIACCGGQLEYADGTVAYFNHSYPADTERRVFNRLEALAEVIRNQRITNSLCDKLYAKEIFHNLRMSEGKIYEDMEIIPRCVEQAEVIVYDPTPKYHYNQTAESTIRGRFNPMRFAEADVALEKARDYAKRYPPLYEAAMANYIAVCLNIINMSEGVSECENRRKELMNQLRKPYSPGTIGYLSRKERIKLKALQISPICYSVLAHVVKAGKYVVALRKRDN